MKLLWMVKYEIENFMEWLKNNIGCNFPLLNNPSASKVKLKIELESIINCFGQFGNLEFIEIKDLSEFKT